MLLRAVLAFMALPGVVAFAVPAILASASAARLRPGPMGVILFTGGLLMLVWCVVAFYRQGRGTLAPWSPPRALVTEGIYALTRNPMYVAVVTMLLAWAVLFRSPVLALYAATIAIAFHLRVVLGEEPWLAKTYGAHWQQYKATVPRWLPRLFRPKSKTAA